MSDFIIGFITDWGYLGIFLLMVAENLFPPIPSELIMPFAGYVAANGDLSTMGVLIAGTVGSVLGTSAWYVVARLLGLARFTWLCNRFGRFATLSEDDIDKAQHWFERHGSLAVFAGRLMPAIRTLISVPAGLAKMPFGRFLVISTLGSLIWTGILTAAGLLLHENYHAVEAYIDPVSTGVVVLAVVIYIWRFITWKPIKDIG
ncbi:membrane protein DedA, SNARE-associated domain [Devosia crocina]|uniref:Membrane protein DedA, SNARE-associated domain n=1 Tax=Devosia crocina TaxID=429728 RepID=A0A1I7NSL4_9HYPH|nr:DedA family protein [Devosia crocina]SFV37592.1 membrane protein DedA, SNARE-associated domain [Devosia crocina]